MPAYSDRDEYIREPWLVVADDLTRIDVVDKRPVANAAKIADSECMTIHWFDCKRTAKYGAAAAIAFLQRDLSVCDV